MKECIYQVYRVGLSAIAMVCIPLALDGYAQTATIDGPYISGVANTCGYNVNEDPVPQVWNCMATSIATSLYSQTNQSQVTLDGEYLRSVGDYCIISTGSLDWNCMAQSVTNDNPFRVGVDDYCTYTYGGSRSEFRDCVNRYRAAKQDCYADPQFFAQPENQQFCQPPSRAVAQTFYPSGASRATPDLATEGESCAFGEDCPPPSRQPAVRVRQEVRDVNSDRYLASRCNSLPPAQRQKATACGGQAQPRQAVRQPPRPVSPQQTSPSVSPPPVRQSKPCPAGFRDDGAFCFKPSAYGRGAGYAWNFGDGFSNSGMFRRCEADNGRGNCEQVGAIVYPKCKSGFTAFGANICTPTCPPGMQDIGISCRK